MELRHPRTTSERDQTFEILRRAFNMEVERERWDAANPDDMMWQLYEGDDLLATSKVHDWGQWFGGRCVPTAGISGVGVAPQHRGRGHASALFHQLLHLLRDAGYASTGLMPASTSLYRGLGYEVASVWSERRIPTRALRELPRATHVTVRYATADDIDALRACHERIAQHRDGWMRMSTQWWEAFRAMFADGFGYAAVDGDEVLGYVWYRHEKAAAWGFGIALEAVIADDPDVYCALWQTIASSSTMVHHVRARNLPPESALLLMMPEQDMEAGLELRYMARLLDVPAAMAARGFPFGLTAQVDVVVDDPIIAANAAPWRLQVADGKGSAEPGGDPGAMRVDIGALTSVFTGWATPHTMRLAGRLRGGTDDDLATLKAMFAGPTPSLQLFF